MIYVSKLVNLLGFCIRSSMITVLFVATEWLVATTVVFVQ